MRPDVEDVEALVAFPFISQAEVEAMRTDLPAYLAACEDTYAGIDPLLWWRGHTDIESWCNALRKVLLVQPSSAAAERVFSLLQNSFSDRQERALEDYIEAAIMLQYNH